MHNPLKISFLLLFLALTAASAQQATPIPTLKGRIIDQKTGEGVPFASVYLKAGKNGMTTDENGEFVLSLKILPDTLLVSEVGYDTQPIAISSDPSSELVVKLTAVTQQLDEVVVMSYRDPGKTLMKMVIAHKDANDPARLRNFVRNDYMRTELDIENFTSDEKRSLLGNVMSVYQNFNKDTANLATLPLYFRENYYKEYHAKFNNTDAKYLIAEKALGLTTDQLGVKFDKFSIRPNAYDGVIPILKTSFLGPVSALGLSFYNYAKPDTLVDGNVYTYVLRFTPKHRNENTFEGRLWIDSDSYAVKKVEMKTSPGVNLNFVRELSIGQDFISIKDSDKGQVWVPSESRIGLTFDNGLALLGLPGKIDSTGRTVKLLSSSIYTGYKSNVDGINADNFMGEQRVDNTMADFKTEYRLATLTPHQAAIYQAADSLRNNSRFQNTTRFAAFLLIGYWDFHNRWRMGPYSSLVSANQTEGVRFRTGIWSKEGISPNWNYWGYLAYGTRDRRFKGGVGVKYVPNHVDYRKYELSIKSDYDALTEFSDQLDHDNVFTLALRKPIPVYQNFLRQVRFSHERDLNHDWSARAYYSYGSLTPTFRFSYVPSDEFINPTDPAYSLLHTLYNSEAGLMLRYAHNERSLTFNYDKLRVQTLYPIIRLDVSTSVPIYLNTFFEYVKANVSVSQDLPMPLKGSFYYNLSAGKVFGTVPLLLLYIPRGNPYYIADRYAFYGMSPYEFAADRYASLQTRYSLGGLIMDRLPLINKFHLRERLIANLYWGDLTKANTDFNQINAIHTTGRTPYAEAGVGVENIFNFFSIDCIWRLNHLQGADQARITRFGIYTGVKIQF
jgi:hypothetical protein